LVTSGVDKCWSALEFLKEYHQFILKVLEILEKRVQSMCKLYKFFKNNKSVSVGAQDFTELLDEAYILMRALTGLSWKPTSFFASYLGWHSGTIEKEANKIFSVG
jgi:hypothetical protein